MLKVICDRCGIEIQSSEKVGYLSINFREKIGGPVLQENPLKGKHFCEGCIQDILEIINAKKVKANTARSPKQKIDYGKIMALHYAGWTNDKIAEEMRMEKHRVTHAIWYYKNRNQKTNKGGEDPSG